MIVIANRMKHGLDVKMHFLTFSLNACERTKSELFSFRLIMMFFMEKKKNIEKIINFHSQNCAQKI